MASGNTTLEQTRRQIDEEMYNLRSQIVGLQRQVLRLADKRNTLAVIYSLPPELLSTIFLFYKQLMHGSEASLSMSWIWVTHVCKRWREIALALPQFWDTISVNKSQDYVHAMLSRSGSIPLRLVGEVNEQNSKHALNLLFEKSGRLTEINFKLVEIGSDVTEEWMRNITSRYPTLRQLKRITVEDMKREEFIIDWFNERIIGDRAPGLLAVCIRNYEAVDLTESVFANLTHLALLGSDYKVTPAECGIFLEVLADCPRLQSLELENTSPDTHSDQDSTPPSTAVIKFPHLQILIMKDWLEYISHLLDHLDYSPHTSMFLELSVPYWTESKQNNDLDSIASQFHRSWLISQRPPLDMAVSQVSSPEGFAITWSATGNPQNIAITARQHVGPNEHLNPWPKLSTMEVFVTLCRKLRLETVTSLNFCLGEFFFAHDWYAAFVLAVNLQHVKVEGPSVLGFVDATSSCTQCRHSPNITENVGTSNSDITSTYKMASRSTWTAGGHEQELGSTHGQPARADGFGYPYHPSNNSSERCLLEDAVHPLFLPALETVTLTNFDIELVEINGLSSVDGILAWYHIMQRRPAALQKLVTRGVRPATDHDLQRLQEFS